MLRMASSNYWFERVLQKLRAHIVSGMPSVGYTWQYDALDTRLDEDKALVMLESLGVVRTRHDTGAFAVEPNGALRYDGNTTNSTRTITDFSAAAYEAVCTRQGIEPYSELYIAQLKLIDDVIPVVSVGDTTYEFRAMYEGKAAVIVRYCLLHEGKTVTLKELRDMVSVKPLTNISQAFRQSLFSRPGVLAPFAHITPDTISIQNTCKLSNEKIQGIRSAAKVII